MSKAMEEEPEIEDVSPDLDEIKKDPLNRVVGDITTQDDPQIKQSASTPNDLWESWLEKGEPSLNDKIALLHTQLESQEDLTRKLEGKKYRGSTQGVMGDKDEGKDIAEINQKVQEKHKFQGMGDARYGNQHETGNSDDYIGGIVNDENVYIQSGNSKGKEDEKNGKQK